MFIPSETERLERYYNGNETVQHLYGDPTSGMKMSRVYNTYFQTDEYYKSYADSVGDVILGFFSVGQLPELLVHRLHISDTIAQSIATDLTRFLSPIETTQSINAGYAPAASTLTPTAFAQAEAVADQVAGYTPQTTIPLEPEPVITPAEFVPRAAVTEPVAPPEIPVPEPAIPPEIHQNLTPTGQVATPAKPIIEPIHTMQSDMDILRGVTPNQQVGYQTNDDTTHPNVHRYQKPLTEAPNYQRDSTSNE